MMTKILLIACMVVTIFCNILSCINKKIGAIWILTGYQNWTTFTDHY